MPNSDPMIRRILRTLSNTSQETACFTTLDLQYAYSQLNLHADTARHCILILVIVVMTGRHRIKTEFFGSTNKTGDFQKAIDCTLFELTNTFGFLDKHLIDNRGKIEDHVQFVKN